MQAGVGHEGCPACRRRCMGPRQRLAQNGSPSRHLMVLQAYIDGSGTGDKRSLVLAGYIADADTWASFSDEWKAQLDHAQMARFKMFEMKERLEIAAYFYRLIEKHNIQAAISIAADTAALKKAVRELVPETVLGRENLENPYYIASRGLIEILAVHQQKFMRWNDPVDFIFDDESEKVHILEMWDWMKVLMNSAAQGRIGSTPIFRPDEKFMPLQAADLYAWWIRKWHNEGNREAIQSYQFPWGCKRDIPQIHIDLKESGIRRTLADAIKKMPFTKCVMSAFSGPQDAARWLSRRREGVRMTLPDPTSRLLTK
ncbi:hypothetical protein CO683_37920 [Bradyrhizobium ottawaense]|nr:hypothetical protein CO683_37920 [Bradyrhizobium ottawaense]